jgi:hypothetical protein
MRFRKHHIIAVGLFACSFLVAMADGPQIWPNCAQQGTYPCSDYTKGSPQCTSCCGSHCNPLNNQPPPAQYNQCIACCNPKSQC